MVGDSDGSETSCIGNTDTQGCSEGGSNPGNLRMFSYVPESINPAAPLIVVLHGCKQKAPTFASDAG